MKWQNESAASPDLKKIRDAALSFWKFGGSKKNPSDYSRPWMV